MKASLKLEIGRELETARDKLAECEKEQTVLSDKRLALENQRSALRVAARGGDAEAARQLPAIRREIAEAAAIEEELAEDVSDAKARIASLEINIRDAHRRAILDLIAAEEKTATDEANELDAMWQKFAPLLIQHQSRLSKLRDLDRQAHGRARDVDLRFLRRIIDRDMGNVATRGSLLRRPDDRTYAQLFPLLLRRGNLPSAEAVETPEALSA